METTPTVLPDYAGGSILNLMRSIVLACGIEPEHALPPHAPLPDLERDTLLQARNLILIVVDGLGYEHLLGAPAPTLRRHLHRQLTSVFPSTTASAVTTYLTALAPQQHGLTGWHMYFREADTVAAVLPLFFRQSKGSPPAMLLPRLVFDHASVFDVIARPAWVVSPQSIIDSGYNRHHSGRATRVGYDTLPRMVDTVAAIAGSDGPPRYIHAYYPELDALAHVHGIGGEIVGACLHQLDQEFARLLGALEGTHSVVLVCADHGFIDSPPQRLVTLDEHPQLAQMLARPLCGERRVAYCYVNEAMRSRFELYVRAELGQCASLHRSAQLIDEGWFGPGAAHRELGSRVGDYTLVMRENWTIKDWLPGERRYHQIGVHGGISAREMFVPLVVAAP